jgi:hypothetical protein
MCRINLQEEEHILWLSTIKVLTQNIGPSGVLALPLGVAAERSVHYFWDIFFLLLTHTFLTERVVLGLCNCARSNKSHKNKILGEQKFRDPLTPRGEVFSSSSSRASDKPTHMCALGFLEYSTIATK